MGILCKLPLLYIISALMSTTVDNKELWNNVLIEMELTVSKANFTTWFKDTYIIKQEEGVVYVSVPNQFVKDWLANKYHKHIIKALRELSDHVRSVEYTVSKKTSSKENLKKIDKESEDSKEGEQGEDRSRLPLQDFYRNKEDNLNPRYDFETFVVGPFNELAYAAAQAVIKAPGVSYNPLFVYGQTGHGKTHLIQAVGNKLKKDIPGLRIYYLTSEKFAVEYLNSIQKNKVNQFKEKYRKYDVLIMDDVQFFSNKEKSQEELFHLFNTLYDNNKQIIFSSDKHPNYIINLEDRLKSRFGAGMIIDIPPPDYESRMSILRAKANFNNFYVSDDIIEYLAASIEGNIRELEGTLNVLMCHAELKKGDLSIKDVKNLIKDSIKSRRIVSIKKIIKTVADFYDISEASIYEKTRKKEIVRPRQIIMYLLREDFNVSYPAIGEKLGHRDHTTVLHSCEKVKKSLEADSSLLQELNQIRTLL